MKTERDLKRSLSFPSPNRQRKKKRAGAILFLAVGAIAVLSILAIGTTSSVLQELKLAKFVTDADLSAYTVTSVIEAMKIVFANSGHPLTIALYDLRKRDIPFGDKTSEINFCDEERKINIAQSPKEILLRLPGLSGNASLVDTIIAAHVAAKEELLLVDGMTQGIYDQFKDLVTTYGSGGVNINTAPAQILTVLGLDEDLIRKILEFRAGDDLLEGTEDDKYFADATQIVPLLEVQGLSAAQKASLELLISSQRLTTSSAYIRFDMTIKRGGKAIRSFKVVLNLMGGMIVSWIEE